MTLEWRYILNSTLLGEVELNHNPVGWDGAENTLSRDETFQGIFNNYSKNSLYFTGNGFVYLKTLYETYGLALECSIIVRHWSVINQELTDEYTGILNGKTYKEVDKYGGAISINIGEGNFQEKLLNRSNNAINYHSDTGIDGQALTVPAKKYEDLLLIGQERATSVYFTLPDGDYDTYYTYGAHDFQRCLVELVQDSTKSNNDNAKDVYYNQVYKNELTKCADGCWAYRTPANVQAVVNLNAFMAIASRTSSNRVMFQIWKADVITDVDESVESPDFITNLEKVFDQYDDTSKTFLSGTFNDTGWHDGTKKMAIADLSISLTENQCLLITFEMAYANGNPFDNSSAHAIQYTAVNKGTNGWFYTGACQTSYVNYVSLDITERPMAKFVAAISPFNLWQRLIENITGTLNTFVSTLLTDTDSEFANVMRFNGYMARGFTGSTLDKSGFTISLNDLFNTDSVLFDAGLGVDSDGNAILESLDDFYTDEVILTIDTVEKETWEKETISGMFYANIESGYDEADYEENGGTTEFNSKSTYSTPVSNVDTKLELLPSCRGDGFGVSSAMILSVSSTDTMYDTDNFFVDSIYRETITYPQPWGSVTINGGYSQRNKEGFTTVTGIDEITTPINLNFTPANLVVRNSERFTNGFEYFASHELKFTSQTIPCTLSTLKTGNVYQISEATTIPLSELKQPRFSGEQIKFGWKLSFADFAYLKAHRYGKIKVKNPITEEYEFGWIKEIVQTTLTDKANFVLLRCYSQNDPDIIKVMVDHNLSYIVTDNAEKITVNE